MSKKKKNRQNDNSRGHNSSRNDKSRRVAKMNGHLLLARNEAAAALLRAAMKEIEQNAVPEVKHSETSMQAFRQFISFSGMFWKSLFQNIKVHTRSDNRSGISPERVSERFSAAARACGKTFVRWISLLFGEIWTVLVLAVGTLFRSIWKFLSWCGFQITRFFRYLKERLYWKKLKYSIKSRIRKEERDKRNAERKAEREEQLTRKREEAEFRRTMKAEEEAFRKAKQKEEEAIRIAKERREEAARMTQRIETELAALSLRRKEEEEKVLQETKRKEEAMAALSEANREEEAERARLEKRRRIEEAARIEAEKQEAEALKRLAEMQAAEDERIRKAEAEHALAAEKAHAVAEGGEEVLAAETAAADITAVVPAEETPTEETEKEEPVSAETKPENTGSEEEQTAVTEQAEETPAKEPETPPESVEEKPAEASGNEPGEQPALEEAPASEPEKESEGSEAAETPAEETKPADQLEKELDAAEEAYLESHRRKLEKEPVPEKGIAASAVHNAVRSLPVHIPTITVPENLDARELITEARDNTNGIIYRVVKTLELPQAAESVKTALIAGAGKYAAIGLVATLCTWIGTARNSGNTPVPGSGTFVLIFFLIAVMGTLLAAGLSWLSGLLVMKKTGGDDNAVFLKGNSVYVPISALAYILCLLILPFNREKFIAVLVAVLLLSVIGHLMVMFREKGISKWYTVLIYLLCIVIAAAVVILISAMFSSQFHAVWNALH